MVQNALILGVKTDAGRILPARLSALDGLVVGKTCVAEHFQPVRVGLPREQFRWAFVNALGMLAA